MPLGGFQWRRDGAAASPSVDPAPRLQIYGVPCGGSRFSIFFFAPDIVHIIIYNYMLYTDVNQKIINKSININKYCYVLIHVSTYLRACYVGKCSTVCMLFSPTDFPQSLTVQGATHKTRSPRSGSAENLRSSEKTRSLNGSITGGF